MRITIEPTEPCDIAYRRPMPTVVVSIPSDDLSVDEVFEMVRAAVLAVGFHPDSVAEYLPQDD